MRRYPPPVIVDEVQHAPALFKHIKVHIDKHRSSYGQFILTGSQKFELMKGVTESLAGRADIYQLETFSTVELAQINNFDLGKVLYTGGFPELWQTKGIDPQRFYSSYVASYLERDVKGQLNVGSLRDFERFLRACAIRSGQLLNKAELAKDIGISPSTANAWLSVLEASGQIFLLEPWFSNKTKSLVKSPKLYFADTGLLNFMLNNISVDDMLRFPNIGQIWEAFVFSELRKQQMRKYGFYKLWFWRDRLKEIDFLEDRGGLLNLIEAKWTADPDESAFKDLEYVERKVGIDKIRSKTIICRSPTPYPTKGAVMVSNLTYFQD